MRTTVVLDEDVLERLKEEARLREATFKGTLNEVIRDGLLVAEQRRTQPVRFKIKSRSMGLKEGYSYDSISKLLALVEGEDAR